MDEEDELKELDGDLKESIKWVRDLQKEQTANLMLFLGIIIGVCGNIIANGLWGLEQPKTIFQYVLFAGALIIIFLASVKILGILKMNKENIAELKRIQRFSKSFSEERKRQLEQKNKQIELVLKK